MSQSKQGKKNAGSRLCVFTQRVELVGKEKGQRTKRFRGWEEKNGRQRIGGGGKPSDHLPRVEEGELRDKVANGLGLPADDEASGRGGKMRKNTSAKPPLPRRRCSQNKKTKNGQEPGNDQRNVLALGRVSPKKRGRWNRPDIATRWNGEEKGTAPGSESLQGQQKEFGVHWGGGKGRLTTLYLPLVKARGRLGLVEVTAKTTNDKGYRQKKGLKKKLRGAHPSLPPL